MFRATGICLFGCLGLFIVLAVFGPALPPLDPAPTAPVLTKPAIERAVEDCRTILGLRDDTVMTPERIALFSLCMHPELKHVQLAK